MTGIGDEMHIIVERWYLGPIIAAVALFGCVIQCERNRARLVTSLWRQNLDRVYSLARDGKFDEIRRSGLTTEATIRYLEMQDQCLGRVKSWMVSPTDPQEPGVGRTADVSVDRPRANLAEHVYCSGLHDIHIALHPTENYTPDRGTIGDEEATLYGYPQSKVISAAGPPPEPIESPGEALAVARRVLHAVNPPEQIRSVSGVTRAGQFWVVKETIMTSSGQLALLLVLTNSGDVVERVAGAG